jgi:AcrR family transcriptional regulator
MAKRKKKLSAAERRAQLIEVGRSTFAELGYAATSVEELASRAGVSKPILYEHFGGKEGLYAVIVDREMERVLTMLGEAIAGGSPRELVEGAAVAFLTYVRDFPDGFAVLTRDSPPVGGEPAMSGLLNVVAERVTDVFAVSFREAGYDRKLAPIYSQAVVGMVTFVAQWWMDERELPVELVASHLSALAWMGLRHLPSQPDDIWPAGK